MNENFEPHQYMNTTPRLKKPFINTPRKPLNFWRRPSFPRSRRNMMAGRYPNMGFRHPRPSMCRQDSPLPCSFSPPLRYPMPNPPPGIISSFPQRPSFYCMTRNSFDNRNNQYVFPTINVNKSQQATEFSEQNSDPIESVAFSDLWVESLAPDGRIYYYNTRTRESTWEKPINVRIIELNEIKKLPVHPEMEQSENIRKQNPNQNSQQQLINNTCVNAFYPQNFSVPARFIMFPPNVCIPPPNFFMPPTENIQKNIASQNIRFMMPAPLVPIPIVARNVSPNNIINEYNGSIIHNPLLSNSAVEYNSNVARDFLPSNETDSFKNCEQNLISNNEAIDYNKNAMQDCLTHNKMDDYNAAIMQNNEMIDYSTDVSFVDISSYSGQIKSETLINGNKEIKLIKTKNEKLEMNTPKCNITLSSSNSIVFGITKNVVENAQCRNEKLNDLKSKDSVTQIVKTEIPAMTETKQASSVNTINKDNPVDKSRPVSSTPIPGTYWCVVWTGDQRVFFYNSQSNESIWERPNELLNRNDVDKMIKISPLSLDSKPLMKEVRKTSPDRSDMTKKLRKNDENCPDFKETAEIKKAVESVKSSNIINVESTSQIQMKPKSCTLSHEQKVEMFCEMLSENKVSGSSTWEKEVHKIVFDSRFLLLPAEERKQVFTAYIKRKSQEEINKRVKEDKLHSEEFISLLREAGVTSRSLFSEIIYLYGEDARFKAIEKMKIKESIFNQYVSELIRKDQERKKFECEQKRNFIELLSENNCFDKEWPEVQNILADDERYKAIYNNSLKENLFNEYIQQKCSNIAQTEKQNRISFSVKNREEEVKQNLSIHLKNREKDQENYKLAISNFKALLEDVIKDSDMSWQSAKKVLQEDYRWNYSEDLGTKKREELFKEFIKDLNCKEKDQFHLLLDELSDITVKTSWLDIRKEVLKDSRCARFSASERKCEEEFKEYLRCKQSRAKSEFKQLLKETKLITHKSKSLLDCSNHLEDIEKALSQDQRYLNLDCNRSDRKKILLSYIDKLHSKGSPCSALPPSDNDSEKRI